MKGALNGKVAIVTGSSKGIGLGIAIEMAREGAKVMTCSRGGVVDAEGKAELDAIGLPWKHLKCDVGKLADIDLLIAETVKEFGRLDIMVASAGINDPAKTHFTKVTPEQYDTIMDVNLKGLFFCGQKAANQMIKEGHGGAIINMSSVNAHLGLDSQIVYTTSKGGIQQLTKCQAIALTGYGIKVNAIAPGPIDTELMRRVGSDKQLFDTVISRTPIGRVGTIYECGRLAVFLASDDSNFIFGQSIYIDGGRGFQAFPTPGYKTVTDADYALLQKAKGEKA